MSEEVCLRLREREVIIIERFGKYVKNLGPGLHWGNIPFVDVPKTYTWRYTTVRQDGVSTVIRKTNATRISTQKENQDFPKQKVITRDNATIFLDAILQYKVANCQRMIYRTQNVPYMLSKLLQAQIRNVAGMLDVDQIIEDTNTMNQIKGQMAPIADKWGMEIDMVKIQKVEAGGLSQVLAKKKQADLSSSSLVPQRSCRRRTKWASTLSSLPTARRKLSALSRISRGLTEVMVLVHRRCFDTDSCL